jgi:protein KRI1
MEEYYALDCEDFVAGAQRRAVAVRAPDANERARAANERSAPLRVAPLTRSATGLPCRFRYKSVAADKYGLKTEEILTLTDKELNQVVSLKKLAPYRDAEPKPKYGGKRERAEAALQRLHAQERAAGGAKVRAVRLRVVCLLRAARVCVSALTRVLASQRKRAAEAAADAAGAAAGEAAAAAAAAAEAAAAAAARARSYVAPTKKARRDASVAAAAAPPQRADGAKLTKNAAKHAKRKQKKAAAGAAAQQ